MRRIFRVLRTALRSRATRTLCATTVVLTFTPLSSQHALQQSPQLLQHRRYTGENSRIPIAHVGTALLGKDSLVYVLDSDAKVIHVAKGPTQLRLISRQGRGPGELQGASWMVFLGDSLAVPDPTLSRITIFPLQGKSVRTVSVTPARADGFYGVSAAAYGRTALVMIASTPAGHAKASGLSEDFVLYLRPHGSAKLEMLARLTRVNVGIDVPVLLRGEKANMPREQPFAITPTWDFARDGAGVVVLDTTGNSANSFTLRIRQWSNDGRLLRTCTLTRPRRPLTNAAYETGLLGLGPPPSARDIVKLDWAVVRQLVVRPASLPPFRSVRLASDGTVWIRTDASFASPHEEYVVLAPSGCGTPQTVKLPLEWKVEDARGRLFIVSGYVDDAPAIDMWRY